MGRSTRPRESQGLSAPGSAPAFVRPSIAASDADLRPGDRWLLENVGLPTAIGDWFEAAAIVEASPLGADRGVVVIGEGPGGVFTLSTADGAVTFREGDGRSMLVNTSLRAFVAFSLEWTKQAAAGFPGVPEMLRLYEDVDPAALSDRESIWALMAEEAAGGMF